MPVGELIACLFCIFMLSYATVLAAKLTVRFQDNLKIVRFVVFGVWVLIADQFGQSMLCLGGAVRAQPKAEAQLGLNYMSGRLPGFGKQYSLFWPKSPERGKYWLEKAAESGSDSAEAVVAAAYLDGKSGLPRDPLTAMKHLQHIADSNGADKQLKADSAYALADLYENGEGVPQNPMMSVRYRMVAADNGNADAAFEVAEGLEKGRWGDPDVGKAFIYYKKAADAGRQDAMPAYARLKEMLGQR